MDRTVVRIWMAIFLLVFFAICVGEGNHVLGVIFGGVS